MKRDRTELGRGRWLALGALVISGLVIGLDVTILVTALPTLSQKLGATTTDLQWVMDAYTLALAGLLLPMGVLADRYGRRRLLLIGLVLFGASSLVASQVTTATQLVWMRAIMGGAAAIVMPLVLSILPTIFKAEERARAVALAQASAMLGLPLGPLVAGWLLNHYDWGSIFLINGPVVVLALIGAWLFIPESRDESAPRLDWLGAILSIASVVGLVYGIIDQPLHGWTWQVVGSLVAGALLLVAFVAWQLRTRAPLLDLAIFRQTRYTFAIIVFVLISFGMMGAMFVLTPYLQLVQGNDAMGTGLRLLPLIGGILVGALGSVRFATLAGVRVAVAVGMLISATGLALLAQVGAATGYGQVALDLTVIGLGLGVAMAPTMDTALGALAPAHYGAGSALSRTLQNVATSFAVGVLGSILNTAYKGALSGTIAGLPAQAQDVAQGSLAGALAIASRLPGPAGATLLHAARDAYAQGMGEVLMVSAVLAVAGALVGLVTLPGRRSVRAESPTVESVA